MHIYEDRIPELTSRLEEYPAVIPLRHPERVAVSWKARMKSLDQLWGLWDTLINVIDPYEPSYLPIDSERREWALGRIEGRLGIELQTDWPVVASQGLTAELTEEERVRANGYAHFYARCCRARG